MTDFKPIPFSVCLMGTQFEIVGDACNGSDHEYDLFKPILNNKFVYKRLLIRRLSSN